MSDIRAIQCDITSLHVDAIVNGRHDWPGSGGVDRAIHMAAGPALSRACQQLGDCAPGEVKLTDGFALPCRFVIHTVGPVWQGGGCGEEGILASCYRHALMLAVDRGVESIAFPAISTGTYDYPAALAAKVAVRECLDFQDMYDCPDLIVFSCYDALMLNVYKGLLGK